MTPDLSYEDYMLDEAIRQTAHLARIRYYVGFLLVVLLFFAAVLLIALATSA